MSNSDLWMRDVVVHYALIVIFFLCAMLWIAPKWSKFRENVYRSYLLGFETECAELATPYKKLLFEPLQRIVSNDETLRSMGCIRMLEIGVKTGENIPFYPEGTHFIGVDWNAKLGEYLVKGSRSWQFSHIIIERLIVGDGSCMKGVPTGCVDIVVTTRSLCSVKSPQSTLREIHRVLAPGGQYLFMEHVPDIEGTFVRWLQMALSRTGVWPSLFGDCRLDADITEIIGNIGFKDITCTPIALDGYVSQQYHLFLSKNHVFGVATR